MILLDTNVISEFLRSSPAPEALAWAGCQQPGDLCVSAITVQEVEYGLRRLPEGRRRDALTATWQRIGRVYGRQMVDFGVAAARETADILVEAEVAGRSMAVADAQIAGICRAQGLTLATRNVKDFTTVADLSMVNPFGE